jgi:hypothetical protein
MSQWNDPQGRPRPDQPTARFSNDPYVAPPVQHGYGQPPAANPFGTEGNEEFGIVGMVFALLGGVLLIVCFTALDWFKGSTSFGDIGDYIDRSPGAATGFATAYFGWFAWVFFVVALLSAIGSSFPSPALRALRVLGVVTAFAAAGLSFLAIQVSDNRSYVDWLKDARIGFYLAVVGFILIGIGAAIGPRKV